MTVTTKLRCLSVGLIILLLGCSSAFTQTTSFTYQGKLVDGGSAPTGVYDFNFRLLDSGGFPTTAVVAEDVQVTAGIFTVNLDFSGTPFTSNSARFLEIAVRPGASTGLFTPLSPTQPLTSAPYSVKSLNADTATNSTQLGGVAANQYVTTASGATSFIQNTTSPQAASNFNISGNGTLGGTLNASGLRVEGISGAASASFGGIGEFVVDAPFIFGGRLRILENGNVGIGATNPTEKLHVGSGNVRWANSLLSENQGGSIELGGTNDIAGTGSPFIDFHFNGAGVQDYNVRIINDLPSRLSVSATLLKTSGLFQVGALGTGGPIPACLDALYVLSVCGSSLRYKQNVNSFVSGLSLIKQLRPVSFNWKANNQADMGLVAEEVAKVEPLLTTTNAKGEIEGVKYDRVGVVLVNAVNEQQAQIEEQAKQIEEQRKQIEGLKKLVCSSNPLAEICKEQ